MGEKLLKLLHEDQVITQGQYQQVLAESERTGRQCEAILQQFDILTEDAIVKYFSQKFRMPVIPWKDYAPDPELLKLVPATLATKHHVFPFAIERGKRRGRILLAIADPSNVAAIDEIAFGTGCTVKAAVSSIRAIHDAIRQYYGVQELEEKRPGSTRIEPSSDTASERFQATHIDAFDAILMPLWQSSDFQEEEADALSSLDQEHPASKVLVELLELAVDRNISEIHLEPFEQEYRARIRVQGVLHPYTSIPDHVGRGIALRLRKLIQRAESGGAKRENQAWIGSFHTGRIRKSALSVGVSFYPTVYGEKILLKPATLVSLRALDQLGLTDETFKLLQRVLTKTEGLLLLMSPPDHGKTTTLYALLQHYQQAALSALLIESPVERVLPGVTQVSGHTALPYQGWHALGAYLDPDVLAVSDLEDEVLLKLAFEMSSGTRVLASYTAGNALSGFKTFAEAMQSALKLSLPALLPVLLDSLNGILVQRLIRTLCPHCKEVIPPAEQNPNILRRLGLDAGVTPLYRAKGCQACFDTGYQGQTGIFEVIRCDKHVIQALLQYPPIALADWQQMLAELPIHTLQQQAAQLVRTGVSSPQEAWRALGVTIHARQPAFPRQ